MTAMFQKITPFHFDRNRSTLVYGSALILIALISIPYLVAARAGNGHAIFAGFLLNPLDGNSYLAKMYEGWRGDWRFTLPYTAEPGQGAYLFLFYLFLGHLARWSGLSLLVVFHTARLLSAVILMAALWRFYRRSLAKDQSPDLAFFLAILGSGLGWLALPTGVFTSDFWVAEAFPFLSSFITPHFALGLALLLLVLAWANEMDRPAGFWGLRLAVSGLALAVIMPFGVVLSLAVLGLLAAWQAWESWRERFISPSQAIWGSPALAGFFWVTLGGGLFLVYQYWAILRDPILAGWNVQNLTPSPPVWDLVLSFSPAILLAIPGARQVIRRPEPGSRLLLAWAVAGLALVFFPWSLQRRFMMGLQVPMVGLAVIGLAALAGRSARQAVVLRIIVILLMLPTNLLVLMAVGQGIRTLDAQYYLASDEARAIGWIDEQTPPHSLILAGPEMGLFIPANTGRRVIYGHPFETVDAVSEKAAIKNFYQGSPQANRLLIERGVDYVFYGPREQKLGPVPALPELRQVYSSGGVVIFQVTPP